MGPDAACPATAARTQRAPAACAEARCWGPGGHDRAAGERWRVAWPRTASKEIVLLSSTQFTSILFNSIQFNSLHFTSLQFNSIQFNSIQFNSIQFSSIQLSSNNSTQFNSAQFSSAQLLSVNDSTQFNVRTGSREV